MYGQLSSLGYFGCFYRLSSRRSGSFRFGPLVGLRLLFFDSFFGRGGGVGRGRASELKVLGSVGLASAPSP